MKRGLRYLRTALALLLVAALLVAALLVPDVVSGWYDSRTLGQVEYTDMAYEPYEIAAYGSFEEELRAIVACRESGIELTEIVIAEGDEALKEEELLAIVNRELEAMYEAGVLGVRLEALGITARSKSGLYPLGDCREIYPQNVYCWNLNCEVEDGTLFLTLDCAFEKVYLFRYRKKGVWDGKLWEWWDRLDGSSSQERSLLWYDYWGISGGEPLKLLMYYEMADFYDLTFYLIYGVPISEQMNGNMKYDGNMMQTR